MTTPPIFLALLLASVIVFPCPALAQGKEPSRDRLYTKADPRSPGGMSGRIVQPEEPIAQILAIPFDAPEKVYEGTIEGSDRQSFRFTGLPIRRYDLVVVYANSFYEGLQLHRGESTLTDGDRKKIDAIVQKSEPFFTHKVIHRLAGETGRGNLSRGVCTFYRDKPADYTGGGPGENFRRTFKLVLLKDVGPGWQVVRTRDLYPITTSTKFLKPAHHHSEALSRIRVADSVKDLGNLDLTK